MKACAAFVFCLPFVLSACADVVQKGSLTAPEAAPRLDVSGSDGGSGVGAAIRSDEVMEMSSAGRAPRAATGARASGYAESFSPSLGTQSKYSFIALSTGAPGTATEYAAKGEVQATIVRTVGGATVTETIHADIDCLTFIDIPIPIFGRMANASGPIKKWTRDGEAVTFPPGMEVLFTVQDNGEGAKSPSDRASALVPAGGRQNCRDLFILMHPSEQGNIHVVFPGERGNARAQPQ
jgi:hypothetical protein